MSRSRVTRLSEEDAESDIVSTTVVISMLEIFANDDFKDSLSEPASDQPPPPPPPPLDAIDTVPPVNSNEKTKRMKMKMKTKMYWARVSPNRKP